MLGENFNRALAEVDQLYNSGRLGMQERATARTGELIEEYRGEPHALGQLFTRLGDAFQKHDENYMRWCVVCVLERVGQYLRYAVGWDGFVQNIQMLTTSNDSTAHALALRAFVPIAELLCGDLTVHHSVIRGLESESPTVLGAALMATDAIAACSGKFAAAVFPHVTSVVAAPRAPCSEGIKLSLRVRAVRVLRHMHSTADLTRRAHLFCEGLLSSTEDSKIAEEALRTMTALAAQSLVDIEAHAAALQKIIAEPHLQHSIVRTALACMSAIARVSSRAPFSGELLLGAATDSELSDETRAAALDVAKTLALRPLAGDNVLGGPERVCAALTHAFKIDSPATNASALSLVGTLASRVDAPVAERVAYAEFFVRVLNSALEGQRRWDMLLSAADSLGCLQLIPSPEGDPVRSSAQAAMAKAAAELCAACKDAPGTAETAQTIAKFVLCVSRAAPSILGESFIEAIMPTLSYGTMAVLADLGVAALRTRGGADYAQKGALALLDLKDGWGCFKIARTACCVGMHSFAATLWTALDELKNPVSQNVVRWLKALRHVSLAESALERPDAHRAVFHLRTATTLLKVTHTHTLLHSYNHFFEYQLFFKDIFKFTRDLFFPTEVPAGTYTVHRKCGSGNPTLET